MKRKGGKGEDGKELKGGKRYEEMEGCSPT